LVNSYDSSLLKGKDLLRSGNQRSPKADAEWRSSRALLQRVPGDEGVFSLSHKIGHAVVACAPAGWRLGIDLECVKPRDIGGLAEWMAAPDEAKALAALPTAAALQHFYRLWTFKEAMIKARGQEFPADLKANTLVADAASGTWHVQTDDAQPWQLRVFECAPNWVLSVVWCAPAGEVANIAWHLESDAPASPFQLVLHNGD
jgi:4'-phosphopantetheinyl transferase